MGRIDSRATQDSNVFFHRQLGHDMDVLRLTFHDRTGQARHMFRDLLHELPPKVKNTIVQGDKLTNELASLVDVQNSQGHEE